METVSYQDRMAYALRQLKTYNKIIRYGLPEQSFSIPEIDAGFNSPFNSYEEKRAKKMLVAASTEAIMSNPAIPKSRKEKVARKNAEEILQAFDAAKLDFAEISVPEREERIKKNAIANRAKKMKRVERALKRKGTKLAINTIVTAIAVAVGSPVAVSGGAIYSVVTLLPDGWKKRVKSTACDILDKAARKVDSLADKFKKTKVGEKMTKIAQKIEESKVVTTIRNTTNKIGEKVESVFERVSNKVRSGARKAWDFVKSLF